MLERKIIYLIIATFSLYVLFSKDGIAKIKALIPAFNTQPESLPKPDPNFSGKNQGNTDSWDMGLRLG